MIGNIMAESICHFHPQIVRCREEGNDVVGLNAVFEVFQF